MPSSKAVTKVDLLQDREQQGEEGRSILNEPQCEASWTENRSPIDPQAPRSSVLLTEAVVLPMQSSSDFSSADADYHFCRPNTVQRPSAVMRPQLRPNVPSASAPPRKHRRSSANQGKSHIALPEPTGEAKQGTPHFYDSSAPAATSSLSHSQKWQENGNFFIRFPEAGTKTSSGLSYTPTAYSSRSQQRNLHPVSPRVDGQACLADPHATCFGGSSNPLDSHHRFSKTHRHFPHYNWPHNMTISTPSPWVHRKYSQASVSHKFPPKLTLTPDLQRSPQCHSFGYQTLPASNLAWQECSDSEGDQPDGAAVAVSSEFETPPSPPIRTSSKLSQRISYISSGQHANLFRPVSFPSCLLDPLGPSNPVVQSPLLVNTAVNDVYTLLDPEPSLPKSTRSTAHNRFFMSRGTGCHSHDEHCPRRALSHSRVFPSLSATTPNSVSEDLQSGGFGDCPPSGDMEPVCNLRDCCKPTAFSQFSHDSKETQLPPRKVAYCYHQKTPAEQERTCSVPVSRLIAFEALGRGDAAVDNIVFFDAPSPTTSFSSCLSGTSSNRENLLQVSIVESETHVYVSLTDSTTNKFGHAEFSGPEHVRLDSLAPSTSTAETKNKRDVVDLSAVFPQLDTTLYEMEEKLWNVVLPAPSAPSSRVAAEVDRTVRVSPLRNDRPVEPFGYGQRNVPIPTVPAFPEYGRSDLDPFGGLGTGSDLRPGGVGGMLLDPNRNMPGMPLHRFVDPQLPPGSVPPGARFDPIGPPMVPGRGPPRGGRFAPDPDHAMPPGFEDMYM
nr:unnamed protein product [Spirometra erinaceieuropaei]